MSNFNLNDTLEAAEKEMGVSDSKWFKIQEGSNKVRILTPLFAYASHFKKGACLGKEQCPECIANSKEADEKKHSKPSIKFLCHVLDHKDGEVKLAQLPYGIAKSLQTLQNDPDYSFNEAPMPYDIKINAEGAGTKEVKYSVIAAPKREPVSEDVIEKLKGMHSPEQVKESMKNKRMKELGIAGKEVQGTAVEYPTEEIDPKDIPF